jgi:hypothetical protein
LPEELRFASAEPGSWNFTGKIPDPFCVEMEYAVALVEKQNPYATNLPPSLDFSVIKLLPKIIKNFAKCA